MSISLSLNCGLRLIGLRLGLCLRRRGLRLLLLPVAIATPDHDPALCRSFPDAKATAFFSAAAFRYEPTFG